MLKEAIYFSFAHKFPGREQTKYTLHNHQNYEMTYLLEGTCEFILPDNTILKLEKKQFVIFPPYFKHKIYSESSDFAKLFLLFTFTPKETAAYYKNVELQAKNVSVKESSELMRNCVKQFEDLKISDRMDEHDMLLCNFCSFILEGFNIVTDKNKIEAIKSYKDKRITDSIKYIEENVNAKTTVDDVANYIHVSKRQLERIFENVLGMSPGTYIKNIRVKRIKNLLMNLDYTLEDIAEIMEYNNVSSVIKAFKRIEGVTPSKFRAGILYMHDI